MVESATAITKKRGRPGRPRKNNCINSTATTTSSSSSSLTNFTIAHREEINYKHNGQLHPPALANVSSDSSKRVFQINRFEPLTIVHQTPIIAVNENTVDSSNGAGGSNKSSSDERISVTQQNSDKTAPQQTAHDAAAAAAIAAKETNHSTSTTTSTTSSHIQPLKLPQVWYEIVKTPTEDPTMRLLALLKDDNDKNDSLDEAVYLQQQKSQEEQLTAALQQQQQQAQQPDHEFYNYFYKKKKSSELLFRKPKMHYIRHRPPNDAELYDLVEYDMDEQDYFWVQTYNREVRRKEKLDDLSPLLFETIMDKLEKEWFNLIKDIPSRLVTYNQYHPMDSFLTRCQHSSNPTPSLNQSSYTDYQSHPTTTHDVAAAAAAVVALTGEEDDSACAVCDDTEVENSNAIVFCDGCNVPVHQDCYGIPYIPEGQWLCKKCSALTPETQVSCVFCPNQGGAFKQTTTGDWGHILCAIWIPEVNVQNPIYMEPIDDVDKIPKSRWKLTCSICRVKQGACIQCDNRHCFTAFHVTCAKAAKLCMRIHTHANQTEGVLLKAYCEKHTPKDDLITNGGVEETEDEEHPEASTILSEDEDDQHRTTVGETYDTDADEEGSICDAVHRTHRTRTTYAFGRRAGLARNGRKIIAKGRVNEKEEYTEQTPVDQADASEITHSKLMRAFQQHYSRGIPIVPDFVLDKIDHLECVRSSGIRRRSEVVTDIAHYWSLKRESRKGASLLKRLQIEPWSTVPRYTPEDILIRKSLIRELRDDLQEVRFLAEQVQDREQLKLERLQQQQAYLNMILHPLYHVIHSLLTKFRNLDYKKKAFWYPVTEKEAPGYRDVIQQPMSLYDIEQKAEKHLYTCLDEFKKDMSLIWENCMVYNAKTSSYYKLAVKLKTASEKLFQTADEKLDQLQTIDGKEGEMWSQMIDLSIFDYEPAEDGKKTKKKATSAEDKVEKVKKTKQEKADEHRRNVVARTEGRKRARQLRQQQKDEQTKGKGRDDASTVYPRGNEHEAQIAPAVRKLRSRQMKLFEFIQPVKPNLPSSMSPPTPTSSSSQMHREVQNLEVQHSPPIKPLSQLPEHIEQNHTNDPKPEVSGEPANQQKDSAALFATSTTVSGKQFDHRPFTPTPTTDNSALSSRSEPAAQLLQPEYSAELPLPVQQIPSLSTHTSPSSPLSNVNDKQQQQQQIPPTANIKNEQSFQSESISEHPIPQTNSQTYNITPSTSTGSATAGSATALFHPTTPSTTIAPTINTNQQTNNRKRSHSLVEEESFASASAATVTPPRLASFSHCTSSSSTNSEHTSDLSACSSTASTPNSTEASTTTTPTTAAVRRRVTRSVGLQASIDEIRKRAKISHEAQALVASYNGVSNIEENIEKKKRTYKENRKIHAPLGWVYLESDEDDAEEEGEDKENENGESGSSSAEEMSNATKKRKRDEGRDKEREANSQHYNDIGSISEMDEGEQQEGEKKKRHRAYGSRNDIPIPNFKRGEIVWAKVNGFPSHPAKFLNYSDEEAGAKLVANRRYQGDILVEFLEVPELHRFGWVGRRTICELGENPEIDKKKLTEAVRTKNSKRIQEAKNGYRCAGKILGLKDTEALLETVFDKSTYQKKKKPKRSS